MLDDFERQHTIKLRVLFNQVFRRHVAVFYMEPHILGVGAGRADIAFRRVNTGHFGAEPRQRLANQPAATSDIEYGKPVKRLPGGDVATEPARQLVPYEAESCRVKPVQRFEAAVRIPPFVRQGRKSGDFVWVCIGFDRELPAKSGSRNRFRHSN